MEKWIKVLGSLMVVALVAMVFAGVALAQGPDGDGDGARDLYGRGRGRAWSFVDEDGDGVCDLPDEGYSQGRHGRGQVNSVQGRGVQGGRGHGEGDGVPDNVNALGNRIGRGRRAAGQ